MDHQLLYFSRSFLSGRALIILRRIRHKDFFYHARAGSLLELPAATYMPPRHYVLLSIRHLCSFNHQFNVKKGSLKVIWGGNEMAIHR